MFIDISRPSAAYLDTHGEGASGSVGSSETGGTKETLGTLRSHDQFDVTIENMQQVEDLVDGLAVVRLVQYSI